MRRGPQKNIANIRGKNEGKKKAKKVKDSPEVKVHKLEIEKLELQDKLKKEKSEKSALIVSIVLLLFFAVAFAAVFL